jgi:hypothetical protein
VGGAEVAAAVVPVVEVPGLTGLDRLAATAAAIRHARLKIALGCRCAVTALLVGPDGTNTQPILGLPLPFA